jgi:hypothetical protein
MSEIGRPMLEDPVMISPKAGAFQRDVYVLQDLFHPLCCYYISILSEADLLFFKAIKNKV